MAEAPQATGESAAGDTLATASVTPGADSATKTPESVTSAPADASTEDEKARQEADAKAEADRVAKLTPEQLKAETDAKAKAEADAKAKQVPEKYEFKTPEGIKVDAEVTASFEAEAKALGLSQEAAQKLYDLGAQAVQKQVAETQSGIKSLQESWLVASKADKEFGGDKLTENLAVAKSAMKFATPELKDILNASRLGDHPEMIRWMYRVAKAMQEDKHVTGNTAPPTTKSVAQRMYPNQN
jgi:hypothetical protein